VSPAHFVDTSALVKRYFEEPGTQALQAKTFSSKGIEVFVSALTYAEVYATFARTLREGRWTVVEHEEAAATFEGDWRTFAIAELSSSVRHYVPQLAATHPLRGADLAQLATAAYLRDQMALDLFVACDVPLARAASAARFLVFNPELDEPHSPGKR